MKTFNSMVTVVTVHTSIKLIAVDYLKELRKNILTHLLSYVVKNHTLAGIEKFTNSPKPLLHLRSNTVRYKLTGQ